MSHSKKLLLGSFVLALTLIVFASFPIHAACTNPSPVPTGYAAPCPVFSLSTTPSPKPQQVRESRGDGVALSRDRLEIAIETQALGE